MRSWYLAVVFLTTTPQTRFYSLSLHDALPILFIDDGSTDNSWKIIEFLADGNPEIKAVRFRKNYGKSQALMAAFPKVKGEVVINMDADLQDITAEFH